MEFIGGLGHATTVDNSEARYQAGMLDGEGVVSAKRKAQAQILDMLQI